MTTNEIQLKKKRENEAVVDEALLSSRHHLVSANKHFDTVIHNRKLRDEFTRSIEKAHDILASLDTEPSGG